MITHYQCSLSRFNEESFKRDSNNHLLFIKSLCYYLKSVSVNLTNFNGSPLNVCPSPRVLLRYHGALWASFICREIWRVQN